MYKTKPDPTKITKWSVKNYGAGYDITPKTPSKRIHVKLPSGNDDGTGARKLLDIYVDEVLNREPLKLVSSLPQIGDEYSHLSFLDQVNHARLSEMPLASQNARFEAQWPVHTLQERKLIVSICEKLRNNDGSLVRLRLGSSDIDDEFIKMLSSAIEKNRFVQHLMLHDNAITDNGINELVMASRWHPCLHTIWLGANFLTDASADRLSFLIKLNFNIKDINISNKWPQKNWHNEDVLFHPHITSVGALSFATQMKNGCGLTSLSLSDQRVRDEGASALFGALLPSHMRSLNLDHNELTDECCEALMKALGCNPCLERLVLSRNNFTDDGSMCIAHGIVLNSVLRALDLTNNKIEEDGLDALYYGVQNNWCLRTLSIFGNEAEDPRIDELMKSREDWIDTVTPSALAAHTAQFHSAHLGHQQHDPYLASSSPVPDVVSAPPISSTQSRSRSQGRSPAAGQLPTYPWKKGLDFEEKPLVPGVGMMGQRPLSKEKARRDQPSPSDAADIVAGGGGDLSQQQSRIGVRSRDGDRLSAIGGSRVLEAIEEGMELSSPLIRAEGTQKGKERAFSPTLVGGAQLELDGFESLSLDTGSAGGSATRNRELGFSGSFGPFSRSEDFESLSGSGVFDRGAAGFGSTKVSDGMMGAVGTIAGGSSSSGRSSIGGAGLSPQRVKPQPSGPRSTEIGRTRGVPHLGPYGALPVRYNVTPTQDSGQHLMYLRVATPGDPSNVRPYSLLQVNLDQKAEIERIKEDHKTDRYLKSKHDKLMYHRPRLGLQEAAKIRVPDYFWEGLHRQNLMRYPAGIDRPVKKGALQRAQKAKSQTELISMLRRYNYKDDGTRQRRPKKIEEGSSHGGPAPEKSPPSEVAAVTGAHAADSDEDDF